MTTGQRSFALIEMIFYSDSADERAHAGACLAIQNDLDTRWRQPEGALNHDPWGAHRWEIQQTTPIRASHGAPLEQLLPSFDDSRASVSVNALRAASVPTWRVNTGAQFLIVRRVARYDWWLVNNGGEP